MIKNERSEFLKSDLVVMINIMFVHDFMDFLFSQFVTKLSESIFQSSASDFMSLRSIEMVE